jgi:hypothetical protein
MGGYGYGTAAAAAAVCSGPVPVSSYVMASIPRRAHKQEPDEGSERRVLGAGGRLRRTGGGRGGGGGGGTGELREEAPALLVARLLPPAGNAGTELVLLFFEEELSPSVFVGLGLGLDRGEVGVVVGVDGPCCVLWKWKYKISPLA